MEKLIYAIVLTGNNPEKLNSNLKTFIGLADKKLSAVCFNQISAVTSDINRTDLIDNKHFTIEYAGIIEQLANNFTLLPMRYGSVLESEILIQKMLKTNHEGFLQNLIRVKNKHEFGLKVFCDSAKLRAEVTEKNLSNHPNPINPASETQNSVFKDYVNRKLQEHRLEEALLHFVDSVIAEIIQYIHNLNPIHTFKKMVSPTLIIDAVFLLEKENQDGLVKAIEDFQNRYPSLIFMLSGPWPPYSFVENTTK